MPPFHLHVVTHFSARKNPWRELHAQFTDRKPETQKGENSKRSLGQGRSVPLCKLDLAPHSNVLMSKEQNVKSVQFFISHRATSSSRHRNAFSHNQNLFQGGSSMGLILYSTPFQNCQTACSLTICCYFFSP